MSEFCFHVHAYFKFALHSEKKTGGNSQSDLKEKIAQIDVYGRKSIQIAIEVTALYKRALRYACEVLNPLFSTLP